MTKVKRMNWYLSIKKLAFPYGRVECPSCNKMFATDFGYHNTSEGGSSTNSIEDINERMPFVDFEKKHYDEAIDGIEEDQVETGTVTTDCPNCKQSMIVEYKWDTASEAAKSADFFSQVIITDVQPVDQDMADMYRDVGMTSGFSVAV